MRRLEDILAEENITPEKIQNAEDVDTKEALAAKQIYSYLKFPLNKLPLTDKKQLKVRIENSVQKFDRKRNNSKWIAVASVLIITVLAGIEYIHIVRSRSDIVNFANNLKENRTDSITRLVLSTGNEVRIPTKETEIKYDKKGEKININSDQKIQQEIEPSKPSYNTIIVPYGKRAQITLSEGTKVWLNSGSQLIYPAVFESDSRQVYIDGEGVFEVSKNPEKPFIVKSRRFDVKVVGTIFNVNAYSDDFYSYAVLEEGTIQLKYTTKVFAAKEECTLQPGDMAILNPDNGNLNIKKVDPKEYLSWRDGFYIFQNERLDNILKKLSRYYNVEISMESLQIGNETFSGSLDLKSTPEEVLNIVRATTSFKYRKEDGKKIIIY